jgi:hypothetical protein
MTPAALPLARSGTVFVLNGLFLSRLPSAIRSTELNARGITLAINRNPSFSFTRQLDLNDHVHELTATRKYLSEQQLAEEKTSKKDCFFHGLHSTKCIIEFHFSEKSFQPWV